MVEKINIAYFSNRIFDLSNFEGSTYFGLTETIYRAFLAQKMSFTKTSKGDDPIYKGQSEPYYSAFLIQSPKELSRTFSVNSIDTSIAFIGGYSALVWMIFGILAGHYQEFHHNKHLLKTLYTEEKKQRPEHHIEEDDADEVIATVLNRQPLNYTYREWLINGFFSICCCCCKSIKCIKER